MKRIAIFAHYSIKEKIEDYVVYLIKELSKNVDKIIFISDSNIKEKELKKIQDYIYYNECKPHGEYDFGSYKKGFLWAKENNLLADCQELILINDSCYGPLFPFEEAFGKMTTEPIDFWGITENYGRRIPHIQSYFLVFKPQVFNSEIFIDFMQSIKKEKCKEDIINNYEIGLTKLLSNNNFKYDVLINSSKKEDDVYLTKTKNLIKLERLPLLKRSILLRREIKYVLPWGYKEVINKYTKYPYNLIRKDVRKNKLKINYTNLLLAMRKNIIKFHPKERRIAILNTWYKY